MTLVTNPVIHKYEPLCMTENIAFNTVCWNKVIATVTCYAVKQLFFWKGLPVTSHWLPDKQIMGVSPQSFPCRERGYKMHPVGPPAASCQHTVLRLPYTVLTESKLTPRKMRITLFLYMWLNWPLGNEKYIQIFERWSSSRDIKGNVQWGFASFCSIPIR